MDHRLTNYTFNFDQMLNDKVFFSYFLLFLLFLILIDIDLLFI